MRRAARVLTTAAVASTLLAGTVGMLRQRREQVAVRDGRRAPVYVATTVLPPVQGPLARAVGGWVPSQAQSPLGRLAVMVWASPVTAVGLALAALTGSRPRWDAEHGVLVVEGARGPGMVLLRWLGMSANAVGQVIITGRDRIPPLTMVHEAAHVRQAERLGPLLPVLYFWFAGRYGYRHNPLERAARRAARDWAGPGS